MKLVSHYFETIAGINIYPIVSFLLFFVFFIVVTIYVLKLDKKHIREMSAFAIDDEEIDAGQETNLW